MNALQHIRFEGLGLVSTTPKTLDRSTKYDRLFAMPDWQQRIVRRNGKVTDVVKDMKTVIYGSRENLKAFAPFMRASSIYQTCRNIWDFWYNRCAYKEDQKGLEQLRTGNRSYWEGAGHEPGAQEGEYGIDCDDFSIAVAQTLLNLGIPCYLRIARYPLKDYFQHVYVVVIYNKQEIIIDCVLDTFDAQVPPAEQKDFLIMDKTQFNGIDVAILSGIGDSSTPLLEVVTGSDFNGLRGTQDEQALDALYQHIKKTRDLIAENPELVKEVESPETFLKMLDYALQYWNTDKREQALEILAQKENEINELRGLSPGSDTSESEIEVRALAGGGFQALGKVGGGRKFFNKVKEAAHNTGQAIKEAAKVAVKYNPLTLAARGGILLAMKTNLFHFAEHLKWGYLSEQQARNAGLDMEQWKNSKEALTQTEDMHEKILQGDKDVLRKEILGGRAGHLDTIAIAGLGALGIEPVTTTASTAAATGFLAKIGAWVKKIDLKKLLKNVDTKKLAEQVKQKFSKGAAPEPAGDPAAPIAPPTTDNKGANERAAAEDTGTPWLPILLLGGLGVALYMGSSKKQSKGLGSVSGRKKAKRKKNDLQVYDSPVLSGAPGHYTPERSKKKSTKKGGHKKGKIKKMKLR